MKIFLLLMLGFGGVTTTLAGSCPDSCKDVCGTPKSCCPAKRERCGSVQLERGGTPSSAFASKGGTRLR